MWSEWRSLQATNKFICTILIFHCPRVALRKEGQPLAVYNVKGKAGHVVLISVCRDVILSL